MSLEIFLRNWSNDLLEWSMIYRTWPIKITSWHKFQNPNDFSFEIKIVKYWSKLDWSVIKKLKNVSDDVLDDVLVAEFNDFVWVYPDDILDDVLVAVFDYFCLGLLNNLRCFLRAPVFFFATTLVTNGRLISFW